MQQLMTQLGAVLGSVVLTTIAIDGGEDNLVPYHQAFAVAAVVSAVGDGAWPGSSARPRGGRQPAPTRRPANSGAAG